VTCVERNWLESNTGVKVEHLFTFQVNEKWEKPMKKVVDSLLDLSYQWADSFRIIGVGIAGYLFLIGTARLVDSIKANRQKSRNCHLEILSCVYLSLFV
jgi:hypothetical protein